MKKFPLFLFFLIRTLFLNAACPCELEVKQEFPGTNLAPIEEIYPCSSLYGSNSSNLTIVAGSTITFKYCVSFAECLDPGNPNYPGVQPNNFPVESISIQNNNGQQGSISYQPISVIELGNDVCPANERNESYVYTAPTTYDDTIEDITFNLNDYNGTIGSIQFNFLYVDLFSYDDIENTQSSSPLNSIVSNVDEMGNEYEYDVAADGTKVIALEFSEGSFSIRDNGGAAEYGAISTTVAGAEYVAPKKYNPNNNTIYLDYTASGSSEPSFAIKLNIKPVPVMLIHGLASSGVVWSSMKNSLINQGWKSSHVATPSYDNDISFAISAGTISSQITGWVNDMKAEGLLMNKVNLVGHSMGGLVSRQYIKNNGGERIQKVITLNTPHSGSELANFVMDGNFFGIGRDIGSLVFGGDFDIDNGAMNSLRVNSDEILTLNGSNTSGVKTHAVSSVFEFCNYFTLGFQGSVSRFQIFAGTAAKFLGFAYYTISGFCAFHSYVLPPPNDGVVGLPSQQGGLSGSTNQNYSGVLGTSHTSTPSSSTITGTHIPNLLKEDPQNSAFANGFSPVIIPPPLAPESPNQFTPSFSEDVEIIVNNVAHLDTLYASVMPDLTIMGADSVSGILVGYYFVALDTVLFDSIFATSNTFTIPQFAGYEGELIIHAMGTDGIGNLDYEGLLTFVSQNAPPLPNTPSLTAPNNGASDLMTSQLFTWNSTAITSTYRLQLALDASFANIVVDSDNLSAPNLNLSDLINGTTYYWRVLSNNASGASAWSETWSFSTIVAAPAAPSLSLPLNTALNVPLATTFDWESVSGAENYQLQIAANIDFMTIVSEEMSLVNPTFDYTFSNFETTYYWRVKANNVGGASAWSETWSFTTEMLVATKNLEKEYALKAYPNPTNNTIFIEFDSPSDLKVDLAIFDASGKQVLVLKRNIFHGKNRLEIDLATLSTGAYQYQIKGKKLALYGKFVKIE